MKSSDVPCAPGGEPPFLLSEVPLVFSLSGMTNLTTNAASGVITTTKRLPAYSYLLHRLHLPRLLAFCHATTTPESDQSKYRQQESGTASLPVRQRARQPQPTPGRAARPRQPPNPGRSATCPSTLPSWSS